MGADMEGPTFPASSRQEMKKITGRSGFGTTQAQATRKAAEYARLIACSVAQSYLIVGDHGL